MMRKPGELIDLEHARKLERIDGRARRRGFYVPIALEGDYQMLVKRYRYPAAEAAKMLGLNIDRKI